MSALPADFDRGNPFSTRRVRPGALPYFFPAGEDASGVLRRLAENGWRGQIVGPHGSGKSTLLAALRPAIEQRGRRVVLVELHDGQRRMPPDAEKGTFYFSFRKVECPLFCLVIDGYEQLPPWRRWLLVRRCRRRKVGLLVTTHRSVGLPEVFHTHVDAPLADRIVSHLLADWPGVIAAKEVAACLARHGEDLREALFELYDLFEQRRGSGKTEGSSR